MFHSDQKPYLKTSMRRISGLALCSMLGVTAHTAAWAQTELPVSLEGGLVGTYQNADEDDVGSEALTSLDLVATAGWGRASC